MRCKILHLPSATYMNCLSDTSKDIKSLFSQYEVDTQVHGLKNTATHIFLSKKLALAYLNHWITRFNTEDYESDELFSFDELDYNNEDKTPIRLEHFDIIYLKDIKNV